eukprot:TRINITY_DN2291_c3_g3_i1.p4 TRINITY_DN2291_c3_g3~~TRINITY_DN2291_c3_g3_i1.p4  ORF type:complete len:120 (+),score=4.04 TRINITY_DN2291_c3_g3_i1:443-802(+)
MRVTHTDPLLFLSASLLHPSFPRPSQGWEFCGMCAEGRRGERGGCDLFFAFFLSFTISRGKESAQNPKEKEHNTGGEVEKKKKKKKERKKNERRRSTQTKTCNSRERERESNNKRENER